MKIIRDKKFRPAVTWNRTHGRKVYNKIELLADAVGMQCFKGRLNNKANWNHPRAALKTFYISPVQMDSDSDGWTTHAVIWKHNNSKAERDWTRGWGSFKDGVLKYVFKSHRGKVFGKETTIDKEYEVLDADYEMLDVKIIEEN